MYVWSPRSSNALPEKLKYCALKRRPSRASSLMRARVRRKERGNPMDRDKLSNIICNTLTTKRGRRFAKPRFNQLEEVRFLPTVMEMNVVLVVYMQC